ncbi:hypothetical protein [Polymorphospora sp. NPDC050346]|uniref:hypothetical protein n=1 Tax=Polymorphospora sp. NPDC050346 TaxID=3155780 RepID=UPI0033EEB2F3
MSAWAVTIPEGRFAAERLYHHETLELTGLDSRLRPGVGDPVLVVSEERKPQVVALGRVAQPAGAGVPTDPDDPESDTGEATLVVTYTRRAFDESVPADPVVVDGPVVEIDRATYDEVAGRFAPQPDRRTWLVSLDLPIEASTPAEAVRIFWSYVAELGPRELPTFVSPSSDELAMQAFVLGEEANQDPEEDDD